MKPPVWLWVACLIGSPLLILFDILRAAWGQAKFGVPDAYACIWRNRPWGPGR